MNTTEEQDFQHVDLNSVKTALNLSKPKNETQQPKQVKRRIVTRWKNLGNAHQNPAPDKSRWKIKRPHA